MKCEKLNLHRNNPKKTYKALSQPTILTIKPFLKKLNKTSTYRVSNLKQRFQKNEMERMLQAHTCSKKVCFTKNESKCEQSYLRGNV